MRLACLALLVGLPLRGATHLSVGNYSIETEGDDSVAEITVTVANTANLASLRVRIAFDPTIVEYVSASAQAVFPRVLGFFEAELTEEDGQDSVLTLFAYSIGGTAVGAAPVGVATFTFQLQAVSDGVSALTFPRSADPLLDQRAILTNSVVDTVSAVAGQVSVDPPPVTPVWYLVGDVAPAGTGEVGGGFGDGILDNADVRAVRYWQVGSQAPGDPADSVPTDGTDRWDSADAHAPDSPPTAGGDAALNQSDSELTFRRSLLPLSAFPRYERRRLPEGGRESREAPGPEATATPSQATLSAGQGEAEAGNVVSIPVTLDAGSITLTTFQFLASVVKDGNASAVSSVTFVKDPALPAPDFNDSTTSAGSVLVGWALDISGGVTGALTVGSLQVTVPGDGIHGDTWTVQIDSVSGTNLGNTVVMDGTDGALAAKPPSLNIDSTTPDAAQSVSVDEGGERACSVVVSGGVLTYTYAWTLDDDPINGAESANYTYTPGVDVVAHPDQSVTKTLVCTVTDSAGEPATADAEWSITVQDVDQDAGAPTISVSPTSPLTGDDVGLSVDVDAVDPDGDTIAGYAMTWTLRDSVPLVSVSGTTLDSERTKKGETWDVSAAAVTDPYRENGESVTTPTSATTSVTIGNTTPTAGDVVGLVVLAGAEITVQLTGTDPDVDQGVDTLTYEITARPTGGQLGTINQETGEVVYQPNGDFDGMDTFSYEVSDGEGNSPTVATVSIFVYSDWLVELAADGATPSSVSFGVTEGATSAFDDALDIASEGGDTIRFFVDGGRMRRDMRGPQDEISWEFEVTVGDTPIKLSWDLGAPPASGLVLCQLAEAGGESIPGSRLDMLETAELIVEPARVTTRYYAILPRLSFDLALEAGWNLISLPIDPLDPSVAAVFAVSDVRADAVYAWLPGDEQYSTVATVQALVGYWVYSDSAVVVGVRGVSVLSGQVHLQRGWNLVGLPDAVRIKDNPAVVFPAWWWNAAVQAYGTLPPEDAVPVGRAFWIYALQAAELERVR